MSKLFHTLNLYFPFNLRLILVITIFSVMGFIDYKKNPSNPKRLKEYLFLASLVIGAVLLGILHDLITYNISKEYFEYGKQLGKGVSFYPKVLKLAINASYSFGLIIGIAFIVANNPSKKYPQLSYNQLIQCLIYPLGFAFGFATFLGLTSDVFYPIFSIYYRAKLSFPFAFERVAFIHWGTYIGSFIGMVYGLIKIKIKRSLLKEIVQ